jgi:hypothetical protein
LKKLKKSAKFTTPLSKALDCIRNLIVAENRYSGKQRLAIFITLIWLSLIAFVSALDYNFNWAFFLGIGALPVAFIWGVVWVIAGFRKK